MARATPKTSKQPAAKSNEKKRASDARATRPSPALRSLLAEPEKENLRWWYRVGSELLLKSKAGKKPDRTEITPDLCQQLRNEAPKNAATTLRQARRLAKRFETWKDLEKFRHNLSISHINVLVDVDETKKNTKSMEEFRDECANKHWSVRDLKSEIQNDKGGRRAGGRPPKVRPPATAAIAIRDLYIAAQRWMAYHDECLKDRSPLRSRKRGAKYDQRLLDSVEKAVAELEKVRGAVKNELAQLTDLRKAIKAALK
jgi:hypothetical protein